MASGGVALLAAWVCFGALMSWTASAELACQLFDSREGSCQELASCQKVQSELESGTCPTKCPEDKRNIVCCPGEDPGSGRRKGKPSERMCREYSRHVFKLGKSGWLIDAKSVCADKCVLGGVTFIVGGETAKAKEIPHMAAIGYGNEDAIQWNCGGALISESFVLTAAHCLDTQFSGLSRWVRLGDINVNSTADDANAQQFSVVDRIAHPEFTPQSHYNDVGLLKLDRKARFDEYVRPACLHSDPNIGSARGMTSGWGKTHSDNQKGSDHLMKVGVTFQKHDDCSQAYKATFKLTLGIVEKTMLCAGDEAKDTCLGDSGGPLQIKTHTPYCMYSIVGVTSFGSGRCGLITKPGVYTKVSPFVSWIEKIVWP